MKRTKFPKRKKQECYTAYTYPINAKEANFVHEYLIDLDIIRAAVDAKLVPKKYTTTTKRKLAKQIYDRPTVQGYLERVMEDRAARTQVTQDRVIAELSKVAFRDPIEIFNSNGSIKSISDIPPHIRACISEFKSNPIVRNGVLIDYKIEIKFYDKMQALSLLSKHTNSAIPSDETKPINYNQFNYQDNRKVNNTNNVHINLDDITDDELTVIKKITGIEDTTELLELQDLEFQQIYQDEIDQNEGSEPS